jgi:mannosyltransferase
MSKGKIISIFLLSLIVLVGAGLRIYKLGSHDLWFDEAISSYIAGHIAHITWDKNPPLYYLLLHFWTKFFDNGEFQLRSLSAIFGIASIFVLYKLGGLFDKKAGLISAFLLAISPIYIWYSQEARNYSLAIFTVLLSVYFFILALRKNKPILWVFFAISSAISLYSSYYYLFIITGEFSVLFIKRYRCFFRKWMICNLFILVSFLPFLRFFLNQVKSVQESFWINTPTLKSILISFENFNVGYNANTVVYSLTSILFFILFILGIVYCLKSYKEHLIILLSFLLFPIAVIFAISQWIPLYLDRQLILYAPFYYIIIAIGITSIKKQPAVKTAVLLFIFVLSISALCNYFSDFMPSPYVHHMGTYIKKPFKPAVNYVKENYQKKDAIVHSNPSTEPPFEYYWNFGKSGQNDYPYPNSYIFMLSERDKYWRHVTKSHVGNNSREIRSFDLTQDIRKSSFGRIWLIACTWERNQDIDENSLAVKELLEKYYIPVNHQEFDGIFVTLYTPRIHGHENGTNY